MEEYSENKIRIKRSIFWKIYFFFIVYICVWATNEDLNDENFGTIDFINVKIEIHSLYNNYKSLLQI